MVSGVDVCKVYRSQDTGLSSEVQSRKDFVFSSAYCAMEEFCEVYHLTQNGFTEEWCVLDVKMVAGLWSHQFQHCLHGLDYYHVQACTGILARPFLWRVLAHEKERVLLTDQKGPLLERVMLLSQSGLIA